MLDYEKAGRARLPPSAVVSRQAGMNERITPLPLADKPLFPLVPGSSNNHLLPQFKQRSQSVILSAFAPTPPFQPNQ